jgi:hypothetical protein
MPSSTLDRIWDIFVFERNWKVIFRVALALLEASEELLLQFDPTQVMDFLRKFPGCEDLLDCERLIPNALDIKVTNKMLALLEAELANAGDFAESESES